MGLQTHVFRRGATYVWRRRLPVSLGDALMQVSLRTRDPLIARRLALILGAEGCRVIDQMTQGKLTRDEARSLLQASIQRTLEQVEAARANIPDRPAPGAWQRALSDDWAMGKACELVGHRGAAAAPIAEDDRTAMRDAGRSAQEIAAVADNVDLLAQAFACDPKLGQNRPGFDLMRTTLNREAFSQGEINHGRQIVQRGRGAAYQIASLGHLNDIASAAADALDLAEGRSPEQTSIQPPVLPAPAPEPPLVAPSEPAPLYDPAIQAVADRLMAQKKRQKMSAQMIDQMRKVYDLFIEATEVTDIRHLRQEHLARFIDVLNQLPKTYRKSPKDRLRTLAQILEAAKGKPVGLSATTINRNIDYIGQLLTKAHGEGFSSVLMLDLGSLRERKNRRDRDDRPAFTPEDVQILFRHPIWQGWKSKRHWQEPGSTIIRDGLFWVPLIAALTGARRAEIAGLKAEDLEVIDGIPVMHFRPNANRGLKNLVSERTLPLHPQLVELGLMQHARAALKGPQGDMFPDQRPSSGTKFGDPLDYRFRLLVQRQLAGNPEGKVLHSFRHYVATQLGRIDGLREQVRKDILGHAGDSITAERYSETTPLAAKLAALRQLPSLPVADLPAAEPVRAVARKTRKDGHRPSAQLPVGRRSASPA